MYKLCVFGGTTEGRELIELLTTQPVQITACVATEYGETLLSPADNLTILAQRLSLNAMIELFSSNQFDLVIDATHPYAYTVTETIAQACSHANIEWVRLLRSQSAQPENAVFVSDISQAIDFLNTTRGNILLTTGSKELLAYTSIQDFTQRIYARVLPSESSLEACRRAGLSPSHIIAMQGPFSTEMNTAILHTVNARYLVTKDGGSSGGFEEKAAAAQAAGAILVVIGRPLQRDGLDFCSVVQILRTRFQFKIIPQVTIIGIGPGNPNALTQEALASLESADCVIGAKRMLHLASSSVRCTFSAVDPRVIANYITAHPEHQHFAILMSGDSGFFSGTKKLLPLLDNCSVRVLPGLSSLSYLCSRLNTSYEDVYCVSLHGREHNIVPDIYAHHRTFVLVGGENGINDLCETLQNSGLEDVDISVGERLSYADERILCGKPADLKDIKFNALCAALIENKTCTNTTAQGLPDHVFYREMSKGKLVPMTKSEVRAVCLSKLQLPPNAICWDIGAGTGSVSVEMALQCRMGHVYAIEQNAEAIELLTRNKARFFAENLTIVHGKAPFACHSLPAPTHAFIGGSSGNLRDIITLLLEKNPAIRIVATAVTLETISELADYLKDARFSQSESVLLNVTQSRLAGPYHLMNAQNPIYIFTLQARRTNS